MKTTNDELSDHELSDQAKAHAQHLISQCSTQASIARAAGVSRGTIHYALCRGGGFSTGTARKILRVNPEDTQTARSGINGSPPATDEDIDRAAQHISHLTDRGVTRRVIAAKSSVDMGTIKNIFTRKRRTSVDTVDRILAVTWAQVEEHAAVPIGDRVAEEYPHMRSLLGHEGAVHRLMDAYGISEEGVRKGIYREGSAA